MIKKQIKKQITYSGRYVTEDGRVVDAYDREYGKDIDCPDLVPHSRKYRFHHEVELDKRNKMNEILGDAIAGPFFSLLGGLAVGGLVTAADVFGRGKSSLEDGLTWGAIIGGLTVIPLLAGAVMNTYEAIKEYKRIPGVRI